MSGDNDIDHAEVLRAAHGVKRAALDGPPPAATPIDPATLLVQAEAALHGLLTGQQRVEVEVDGYRVQYSKVNIAELRAYIGELRGSGRTTSVVITSSKGYGRHRRSFDQE